LNIDSSVALSPSAHQEVLDRMCDGIVAALLSLKRRPVIRYEKTSELAQRTAQELAVRKKSSL
jgi:vacuolar protein sorting-associated protein 45